MTFSGDGTETPPPVDLTLQTNTQLQAAAK